MSIEFFTSPDGTNIVMKKNSNYSQFSKENIHEIKQIYNIIENQYPKAFTRLKEIYGQSPNYKYLIVRRFIKCNSIIKYDRIDIDGEDNFTFEIVHCPLRGECLDENIICNPEEQTTLTKREIEIIKLITKGLTDKQIAQKLFISIKTAQTHRENIHKKLETHSKTELCNYTHKHNLI